jgi:ferredoxin like protein
MKIEDKLYTVGSKPDEARSHLLVKDPAICLEKCGPRGRPCTTFCPAGVYVWETDKITVAYNNCLECTACRNGCPFSNIDCTYPRGGFGVAHKYG